MTAPRAAPAGSARLRRRAADRGEERTGGEAERDRRAFEEAHARPGAEERPRDPRGGLGAARHRRAADLLARVVAGHEAGLRSLLAEREPADARLEPEADRMRSRGAGARWGPGDAGEDRCKRGGAGAVGVAPEGAEEPGAEVDFGEEAVGVRLLELPGRRVALEVARRVRCCPPPAGSGARSARKPEAASSIT